MSRDNDAFVQLGRDLREQLGDGPDSERRERLRQRVVLREVAAAERLGLTGRRWASACAALAACALLVVSWSFLGRTDTAALAFTVGGEPGVEGQWLQSENEALHIGFADGSLFSLDGNARSRVLRAQANQVLTVLETGRLRATVNPASGASWSFQAGPYQVLVLGTVLEVAWSPISGEIDVVVERGKVSVSAELIGLQPLTVSAGQRLVANSKLRDAHIETRTASVAVAPAAVATSTAEVSPAQPSEATAPVGKSASLLQPVRAADATGWRELAQAGKYALAVEQARAQGMPALVASLGAADLELLADAARFAGEAAAAKQVLLALRSRFAGTSRSGLAAFRLGLLSAAASPAEAEGWFKTFVREAPSHALAADARGRLISIARLQGHDATAAARDYLRRHPAGAYAELARSLVQP